MNFQIQKFLQAIQGNWITKKTIYHLKNKRLYNYEESIKIDNYNIYDYLKKINVSEFINIKQRDNNIQKKNQKQTINTYKYTYNQNNYRFHMSKYKMSYIEYLYEININLKISIAVLKYLDNYVAIIFTSYIKKIN